MLKATWFVLAGMGIVFATLGLLVLVMTVSGLPVHLHLHLRHQRVIEKYCLQLCLEKLVCRSPQG